MNFPGRAAWAPLLFLGFVVGCGGPAVVPVKGLATRNGKPLKHLYLTFIPPEGRASSGLTDDDGRFELIYDPNTKGALPGTHKVTAEFRPRSPKEEADLQAGIIQLHPDADAIREKYGKPATTPLRATITSADQDIELKLD